MLKEIGKTALIVIAVLVVIKMIKKQWPTMDAYL